MKCSVFIATSLDGYIARQQGEIDWLTKASELAPKGEDCGYQTFIDTVDILIMGRGSFETVVQFEPWPYGALPVIVMTQSGVSIPPELAKTVTQTKETPTELIARLSKADHTHAYIDGGRLIQSFLNEDLINEMTISTAPVLIGGGLPLFGTLKKDIKLTLQSTKGYDFGFVQSTYRIASHR